MGGRGAQSRLSNNPYIHLRPDQISNMIEKQMDIIFDSKNQYYAQLDVSSMTIAHSTFKRRHDSAVKKIEKAQKTYGLLQQALPYAQRHNRNNPF